MSGLATVNLLEVENPVGDRAPGIESRFGRKHLDSPDLGVSLFRYAADLRSPMAHTHREPEQAYVVVAGSGPVVLDDEVRNLRQWEVVRVAPEVLRRFEAGPLRFGHHRCGLWAFGSRSGRLAPDCPVVKRVSDKTIRAAIGNRAYALEAGR